MSYRNPRFSYVHTLRDIGDGGFTANTDAFRADTPRTRLMDDQAQALCGQSDTPAQLIEFEKYQGVPAGFSPLRRVLIPAGHNFGLDRSIQMQHWSQCDR